MKKPPKGNGLFPESPKLDLKMKLSFLFFITASFFMQANVSHSPNAKISSKSNEVKEVNDKNDVSPVVVKGIIVDSKGLPLPGANVVEKGTKNGIMTDFDGRFSITVQKENAVLVISFTGYDTQEIALKGQTNIKVILRENVSSLNEVVVVGYGKVKKKDLTGAVFQIKPDNLANENPQTVQDLLRGVPGIQVGLTSDAKGGGSIQVRGQNSLYTGGSHNSPLIILDGMQFYGEFSEINPDDIGQIDILKDASATAVYGSKASAGVIIITTKKGKKGKPVITFNSNLGINTKANFLNVYSPEQYLKLREDYLTTPTYGADANGQWAAYQTGVLKGKNGYYANPDDLSKYGITLDQWMKYNPTIVAGISPREEWGKRLGIPAGDLLNNFKSGNTFDWYRQTLRTGITKDHNVSASGSSDGMNYYMSFGLLDSQGIKADNDYTAIRSNIKVNGKITDWLELGTNINFQDRSDGDLSVPVTSSSGRVQHLNSPYASYKDAQGNLVPRPMGAIIEGNNNNDYNNQFKDLESGYTVLNTIFNTKVTLPHGITYSFNISPRLQYYYKRSFSSWANPLLSPTSTGVTRSWSKNFDYNLNNTIEWDHTFNQKHHVMATFVQEAENRKYWSDNINAMNIQPSDALGFHNTDSATLINSSFSANDTHQSADALMARLFYSFDDRYMITATYRRDGYSAFGANNPYAYFPSVAVAWSFKNEKWLTWDALSTGKLRLSWGKNGNRSLENPYVSLANLVPGNSTMGYINNSSGVMTDVKYLNVNRMANPNLAWEKTTATNVGLDLGFLNNRINATVDMYYAVTHDMIMKQRLPSFTGFSDITTNLGEVQNKGIELSLNTLNIKKSNFEWSTIFGFSFNENRINKLYGNYVNVLDATGNVIDRKEADDITNNWFIGKPIGVIWNYQVTGIWGKDQIQEAAEYGQKPGDPIVANNYTADDVVNSNGTVTHVYNDKDKVFMGSSIPKALWSMRNNFKFFHNFEASFSMYAKTGYKSLNSNYLNRINTGNQFTDAFNNYVQDYWTVDQPTKNGVARLDAQGPSTVGSPARLLNRSFVRLDNISLAYSLPKDLIAKYNLQSLKIMASIRNVALFTSNDWKNLGDPESDGAMATRSFNLGFNLTL